MSIDVNDFLKDWTGEDTPSIPHLPPAKDASFVGLGEIHGKTVCIYTNADEESDKVASFTPVTPETRDAFWATVKAGKLVVYADIDNKCILGLVKYAGNTHVAYDNEPFRAVVAGSFTDSDRSVSKSARVEETVTRIKAAHFDKYAPMYVTVIGRIQN